MKTLFATARARPASGRICFPITNRAYYGRSQLLIKKLHAHPDIELELMLGGSILLDKYSQHIADDIEARRLHHFGVAVQRDRRRQPRGDGEDGVPDRARVHQRPARAQPRRRDRSAAIGSSSSRSRWRRRT